MESNCHHHRQEILAVGRLSPGLDDSAIVWILLIQYVANFQIVVGVTVALDSADLFGPLAARMNHSIEGPTSPNVDLHVFSFASVCDEYIVTVAILKDL